MAKNNNYFEKYLTDAVLVSVIIGFSYVVQVFVQLGRFQSYGINNPSDLISLDLPGTLSSLLPTVIAVLLVVLLFRILMYKRKDYKKRFGKAKASALIFVWAIFFSTIYLLPVYLEFQLSFANVTYITTSIYILIILIISVSLTFVPHSKKKSSKEGVVSLLDNLLDKIKPDSKRNLILLCILFLVLIPIWSYCIGYITPRIATSYDESKIGTVSYVVIYQTKERVVLASLSGDKVTPNYKYINLSSNSTFNVSTKQKQLDFFSVGPWSKINN